MENVSKEYLDRLIREAGIKFGARLGGAKHAAMIEIIKLLDENSLGGLLASIRKDYETAQRQIRDVREIALTMEQGKVRAMELRSECSEMTQQRNGLRKEIDSLTEQIRELELRRGQLEMLPEDSSRLLAYEAAIEIGKRAFDGKRIGDDEMKQIVRSASNVASNWVRVNPEEKKERG